MCHGLQRHSHHNSVWRGRLAIAEIPKILQEILLSMSGDYSQATPAPADKSLPPIGRVVEINGTKGTVRFAGTTSFATGLWIGIELEAPKGKNDGSVQGTRYFTCEMEYGVFVRPSQVRGKDQPSASESNFAVPATPSARTRPSSVSSLSALKMGTPATRTLAPASSTTKSSSRSSLTSQPGSAASSRPTSRRTSTTFQNAQTSLKTPASSAAQLRRAVSNTSPLPRASSPISPPMRLSNRSGSMNDLPRENSGSRAKMSRSSSGLSDKSLSSGELGRSPLSASMSDDLADVTPSKELSTMIDSSQRFLTETQPSTANPAVSETPIRSLPNVSASNSRNLAGRTQDPPLKGTPDHTVPAGEEPSTKSLISSTVAASKSDSPAMLEGNSHTFKVPTYSAPATQVLNSIAPESEIPVTLSSKISPALREPPVALTERTNTSPSIPPPTPVIEKDIRKIPPINPSETLALSNSLGEESKRPDVLEHTDRAPLSAVDETLFSPPTPSSYQSPSKFGQLVPMRDLEDLRIKVKHLELKRAEDRDRLIDLERLRTELDTALVARNKLTEKMHDFQLEMKDCKRQLKHALEENQKLEVTLAETQDNMEMLTLDKEVAEEKADSLQAELLELEEKFEEMTLNAEVLKQEEAGPSGLQEGQSDGNKSNIAALQLERQNERLKEALVRLRDVTSEQEAELKARIEELENETHALVEYHDKYERVSEQLVVAEATIEDLKALIDDSLGAEEMVESLTDKNMSLNEKLEEAKAEIQDLEALKELNDELEQDHLETEKLLQEEIDIKDALLADDARRISAQEEALGDYERTILQFRELVKTLQADLRKFGTTNVEGSAGHKGGDLSSQSQEMVAVTYQLQTTTLKAQARAIELELRQLEVEQAALHLNMVKPYLPEAFFREEEAPLNCILLLQRIIFKANLVSKRVRDRSLQPESIGTSQCGTLWKIAEQVLAFSTLAAQMDAFISQCSEEQFVGLARILPELESAETALNSLVTAIKQEDFSFKPAVAQALLKSFQNLEQALKNYIVPARQRPGLEMITNRKVLGLIDLVNLRTEKAEAESTRIGEFLSSLNDRESQAGNIPDAGLKSQWQATRVSAGRVKASVKRIQRRLLDMSDQGWSIERELLEMFESISKEQSAIGECFSTLAAEMTKLSSEREGSESLLESADVRKIFERATAHSLGGSNSLSDNLGSLLTKLSDLEAALDQDTKWTKVPVPQSPWLSRASRGKAAYTVNTELQNEVESLNDQVLQLARENALKDENLQEASVKIALLESRMELVRKHADTISSLETELAKTKEKSRVYEDAVASLHADLEQMEAENEKISKMLRRLERQQGVAGISVGPMSPRQAEAAADRASTPRRESARRESSNMSMDGDMLARFESLSSAVRFLRAENARLKGSTTVKAAASLFDFADPVMRLGRKWTSPALAPSSDEPSSPDTPTSDSAPAQPAAEAETLTQLPPLLAPSHPLYPLTRQADSLKREVFLATAATRVVDVTRMPSLVDRKWVSIKHNPRIQKRETQDRMRELASRSEVLSDKIRKVVGNTGSTGAYSESNANRKLMRIGRVRLPNPPNQPASIGKRCVLFKTQSEFANVHAVFAS
ncbi:dynein associated protein-domain-containing protein [Phlyctochytrium arcticum]|nr:dynein associated protein-domain-containing protein [Phlyctochytrium arcticum]